MKFGRRHLFIYWRVAKESRAAALAAARELQRDLGTRHAALVPALFIRDTSRPGECTLMEVYATEAGLEPDGVGAELESAILSEGDAATARWRIGSRHVEPFDGVA